MLPKTCTRCGELKPLEAFSRHAGRAKGTSWCLRCRSGYMKVWRQRKTPEQRSAQYRRDNLRRFYDLTPDQFAELLAGQGNCCAICRTDTPGGRTGQFHVDHDHGTHEVRGLLCHHCNTALGLLKEDPGLLRKAIAYLQRQAVA